MNTENARLLAGLSELTRQARDVDSQAVDVGNATLLAQLGQMDDLASRFTITTEEADAQQRDLIDKRAELLREMIDAGLTWQYRNTRSVPQPSRAQMAREAVDMAQSEGARLTAFSCGTLEALPGPQGISTCLRERLVEYRAEIVANLRAGIVRVEPSATSKHRAA